MVTLECSGGERVLREISHSLNVSSLTGHIESAVAKHPAKTCHPGAMRVKWSALFCFSQFVSVLTLVFLGLPLGVAQEQPQTATETAAIHGKVTDRTGAVVHDAKAVLASATGARLAIPVNGKGEYSVTGFLPGTYTLTVSAARFCRSGLRQLHADAGQNSDAGCHPGAGERQTGSRGGWRGAGGTRRRSPGARKLRRARAPSTGRRPIKPWPSWPMRKQC